MSTLEIAAGTSVPLRRTLTRGFTPQTGATVWVDVVRLDGLVLDWSDNTFKAVGSITGGNRYKQLAEVSAVNFAGSYQYTWDTSTITNATTPDRYVVNYSETAPLTIPALDQDTLLVGALISTRASATALATAQAAITATQGVGFTAGADDLHSIRARGDAAWITATGFATPTNVTDAVGAIEVYGQAHWTTATGFAVPGDAMTLTAGALTSVQAKILDDATPFHGASIATILAFGAPPSAAANAAAVWATAEGTGTMGASLGLLRKRQTNKRIMSSTGVVSFYADDGVTVAATATITDVNGSAISVVAGDPARSSAET